MVKTLPSNAGGAGSIPGRGARIPHAAGPKNQNIKQRQHCNKFNKNFKNGPHHKIVWEQGIQRLQCKEDTEGELRMK